MLPVDQFHIFKTISLKYYQADRKDIHYMEICNDLFILSQANEIIVNGVFKDSYLRPLSIHQLKNGKVYDVLNLETQEMLWTLSDLNLLSSEQFISHRGGNNSLIQNEYDFFLNSRYDACQAYSVPIYKCKELLGIITFVYANQREFLYADLLVLFLNQVAEVLFSRTCRPDDLSSEDELRERAIKDSREYADDILQSIDDVMWYIDLLTGEHYYASNADRIFGYTSTELMEDKDLWWKMIHPEDVEQVIYKYDLLSKPTSKAEFEYRAIRKDGIEINVYTRIKIEKNQHAQPVKVLGIFSDITGLRNTERRLNRAQSIAKVGSWEFDLKTQDFSWSKQHYELFELTGISNQGLYEAYRQKIFPEDLIQLDAIIDSSIRLGTVYEFEYRILCISGEVKYILSIGECIKSEKDDVIGLRGTSQDITERKKIEAKLAYQNKQIIELTEAVNQSAMVTRSDAAGTILFANDLFCEISGYKLSELVNQNDRIFNSGYHSSDFWEKFWSVISSGNTWKGEIKNKHKNGTYYWVYTVINPVMDTQGCVEEYLAIRFDVTERKNAELELAYVKKQTDEIIGNTDGALWSVNAKGDSLFVNHATARLTGYTIHELMNDKLIWTKLYTPDIQKEISDRYQAIFQTHNVGEMENCYELITKSGEKKWVLIRSRVMRNEIEELVRLDTIMTDVTKQVKYEEQIKLAMEKAEYANIAKTEFLANMSHEIRTPMNAILGFADLLKGSLLSKDHQKYLDGILAGGKGLMSLINDILDLSKIEAGKMEIQKSVLDIRVMMQELDSLFIQKASSKNLKLIHTTDPAVPKYLLIDEVRLRQILFNLIGNAIKFTDVGNVSTHTSCEYVSDGKIRLSIKISDTGIGIPKYQQEIIFEPFRQMDGQSTRKYGGTGLGLAITKRLVQIMNGNLEITSKVDFGTTIVIYLNEIDVSLGEEGNHYIDEDIGNINFLGQTILLVEDVKSNREIIKEFLKPYNVVIIEVENGEEALTQMEIFTPSLIFMDMMMPVMDGYLTTKEIRSRDQFKHVPIVAITASALSHNEDKIRELCDDYIRKPFTKKELVIVLKAHLAHDVTKPVFDVLSDSGLEIESNEIDLYKSRSGNLPRYEGSKLPEDIEPTFKAKVLLVEDHALNQAYSKALLNRSGYDVILAETGKDAIKKARFHKPDIILLDIVLPDMNGTMVIQSISEAGNDAAIIVLSGYSEKELRKMYPSISAAAYLLKPIDPVELIASLEKYTKPASGNFFYDYSSVLEIAESSGISFHEWLSRFLVTLRECELYINSLVNGSSDNLNSKIFHEVLNYCVYFGANDLKKMIWKLKDQEDSQHDSEEILGMIHHEVRALLEFYERLLQNSELLQ